MVSYFPNDFMSGPQEQMSIMEFYEIRAMAKKWRDEHNRDYAVRMIAQTVPKAKISSYIDLQTEYVHQKYKAAHGGVVSEPQFLDAVKCCNYEVEDQWLDIHDLFAQDTQPLITFGTSRGYAYTFSPTGGRLLPTEPERAHAENDTRKALPDSFIGVNTQAEPAPVGSRRAPGRSVSERSLATAGSDDTESEGSVFFQLGELLYAKDTKSTEPRSARARFAWDDYTWEYSGFVVCLDVSQGRAGGIWVLFDFDPTDDEGTRAPWANDHWGLLPEYQYPQERFSMAKICSIDTLGMPFDLTTSHPSFSSVPEYVWVRQQQGGCLLREWV